MHNRDKYPEIWAGKVKHEKELEPLLEKRKVYTDQIAEIQLKIQVLKDEKEALNVLAMQDVEKIGKHRSMIARMARAMGAVVAGDK